MLAITADFALRRHPSQEERMAESNENSTDKLLVAVAAIVAGAVAQRVFTLA